MTRSKALNSYKSRNRKIDKIVNEIRDPLRRWTKIVILLKETLSLLLPYDTIFAKQIEMVEKELAYAKKQKKHWQEMLKKSPLIYHIFYVK